MNSPKLLFFLLFLSFTSLELTGQQAQTGQFLINGDFSFFNNHDKSDRSVSQRTIAGESVPAYDYVFQQYASNLTANPRIHYFITEKWSVGVAFGFRHIVSKRFVDKYSLSETSEYVSFLVPSLVQNTTNLYSPKLEVARHWQLSKRLAINLTAVANWNWVILKIEEAEFLDLTKVEDVNNWNVSADGLDFKPSSGPITTDKSTKQSWSIGVFPQLRYAITNRFGLTAAIGGINLSQDVKDIDESFVKAAPNWSIQVNPSSWTFGLYGLLGGRANEE